MTVPKLPPSRRDAIDPQNHDSGICDDTNGSLNQLTNDVAGARSIYQHVGFMDRADYPLNSHNNGEIGRYDEVRARDVNSWTKIERKKIVSSNRINSIELNSKISLTSMNQLIVV